MTLDASQLRRPELQNLLALWQSGCCGSGIPAVGGLCDAELAPFLGHMVVIEIDESTDRLRFQQVGQELTPIFGDDLDGRYLDDLPSELHGYVEEMYRSLVANRAPQYAEFEAAGDSWMVIFERLLLPIRDAASDRVAGALVAIYPRISISKRAPTTDFQETSVAA